MDVVGEGADALDGAEEVTEVAGVEAGMSLDEAPGAVELSGLFGDAEVLDSAVASEDAGVLDSAVASELGLAGDNVEPSDTGGTGVTCEVDCGAGAGAVVEVTVPFPLSPA